MDTIRVLLAGDQKLVRAGLRSLLEKQSDIEVIAEATDGPETIRIVEQYEPDVVLIHTARSEFKCLEVARHLANTFPHVRVVILSMYSEDTHVYPALQAGAAGYLLTSADEGELQLAIQEVVRNKTFLSPPISRNLIAKYARNKPAAIPSLEVLSKRQRQVLQLIAEGKSNKQIAAELNISPKTVESHRTQVMDRLEIHDLAGLVRFAIKVGMVGLDD